MTEEEIRNIAALEHTDVNPLAPTALNQLCNLALAGLRYRKVLERVREVIMDEKGENKSAICDTIWEDDSTTLVDYIDIHTGALSGVIIYMTKLTNGPETVRRDRQAVTFSFDELASLELSDGALEAGSRAISDWDISGGFEDLGSYDLTRRVFAAVLEALSKETSAKK